GKEGLCIHTRKTSRGFTMIELVIVVALMGILALLFMPKDFLQTFNLETAAARIKQDIRYAKELAATTNINCGVNFVANGSYTVYSQSAGNPVTNPFTRQPFTTNIADEFKTVLIGNTVQVEFDPMGKPVLGSGQSVQITNGTTTVSLLITPNTGLIQQQ
ncbi:MAG: prepilin-type N-terminal cleavage/methylation domain-containing protein, partial [Deltaproteobacteria bacterium]|nr:prepilin-type N-terminal cleavage/methylation domain-containing protein [Deltaproteobacteria bacterium]